MEIQIAAKCLAELGSPIRLQIFRFLIKAGPEGVPVKDVQAHLGIPKSTLSHHLAHMVWAGLIEQCRVGRMLMCSIRYEVVTDLLEFLQEDCCAGLDAHGPAVSETTSAS